jgi:hypothetical protein
MDFIPPLQEDVQIIVQESYQRTLIFQLQAILRSQADRAAGSIQPEAHLAFSTVGVNVRQYMIQGEDHDVEAAKPQHSRHHPTLFPRRHAIP